MPDGNVVIEAKLDFAQMRSDIRGMKGMLQGAMAGIQTAVDQMAASTERAASLAQNQAMMQVAGQISNLMQRTASTVWSAGVEFESAFVGVKKTVDASEAEFARLQKSAMSMSERVPVSASELSHIMELGGQLGILFDNLPSFSETIASLAVSTDLTSEAAATMFAQFANITHMDQSRFSNLGSALVDLGNNFATTESSIMSMSQRLAPFATLIGMRQSDILGWATAMSSVGIEAEAGGTAMTKLWQEMEGASNVNQTLNQVLTDTSTDLRDLELMANLDSESFKGLAASYSVTTTELKDMIGEQKNLEAFTRVAGMTAEEFSNLFGEDATKATRAFLQGLAKIQAEGGSVSGVLEEMDMNETRLQRTVMSLAGAHELVGEAVATSSKAFDENSALAVEAGKRFETTESKVQMVKNAFANLAAQLFQTFKPAIDGVIDAVRAVVEWFSDLDPAVQMAIGVFAALIGVVAMVGAALPAISAIIGGIVAALTSPVGLVVAIGAAVLALGIFAGVSIANAQREAELEKIKQSFGELKLSAEELARVANAAYAPQVDVSQVTAALEKIQALTSEISALSGDISNTLYMVSVGVTLTAEEQTTLKGQVDALVTAGQELIDAHAYNVGALVDVLWGKSEKDDVSGFQTDVEAFATASNLLPAALPAVEAEADVSVEPGAVTRDASQWDSRLRAEITAEKLIPSDRRAMDFSVQVDLETSLDQITTSGMEADGKRVLVAKADVEAELGAVRLDQLITQYKDYSPDDVVAALETKAVEAGIDIQWAIGAGTSDEGEKAQEYRLIKGIETLDPQADFDKAVEGKDFTATVGMPVEAQLPEDGADVSGVMAGLVESVQTGFDEATKDADFTATVDVPVKAALPEGAVDLTDLIDKISGAIDSVKSDMEAKGRELRQAMDDGLADGVLDASEAAVIAKLKDEYVQLTQRMSEVEMEVELQKIRLGTGKLTLDKESYDSIKSQIALCLTRIKKICGLPAINW
jgi:hypothetical protein